MAELVDLDPLLVVVDVPQRDIESLREAGEVGRALRHRYKPAGSRGPRRGQRRRGHADVAGGDRGAQRGWRDPGGVSATGAGTGGSPPLPISSRPPCSYSMMKASWA
ncbi:MAG: hypothetical protein U5L11_08310 [Arhodomonas sp.]|nr:hypothetical protein [Arhodomonas sp.]